MASTDEASETQSRIEEARELEFYSASVNAWLSTKFERDKSLLTLSAGAIGLLLTFMSAFGVKSVESLILYILALACFIVCLGALLWIFSRNAKHLEDIVHDRASFDAILIFLDRTAVASFMLGVLLSSIVTISSVINSYLAALK